MNANPIIKLAICYDYLLKLNCSKFSAEFTLGIGRFRHFIGVGENAKEVDYSPSFAAQTKFNREYVYDFWLEKKEII